MGCVFHLVTGNRHKVEEAQSLLSGTGIILRQAPVEKMEVQDEDLARIALEAARHAYSRIRAPVIVDDSGLFVDSLKGFPGPYSSYAYKTIGVEGLLRLMHGVADRRACFRTALAVIYPPLERVFEGLSCGQIALEPRGSHGFGFDPVFIPEGENRTFAEMSLEEKNRYSHRARAFRAFAEWARRALGCGEPLTSTSIDSR